MSNISNIPNVIRANASRGILLAKKVSPEILVGAGVVGVIGAAVMACKATLQLEPIIEIAKDDITVAKTEKSGDEEQPQKLAKVYVHTAFEVTKLYAPAVMLGTASIGCILGSHTIMRRRNAGLVAAYKIVDEGFKKYRARVVQEHGSEKDKEYLGGIHETVTVEEHGERHVKKKSVSVDPSGISPYAKFFDESCAEWSRNAEYNMQYLRCQQNHANDMLRARGHLFLNEVYDLLGIPRTKAGALVGWVWEDGVGDDFVDFGLYDLGRTPVREFVNGYEKAILLDFNVEGPIYDLI